MTEDRRKLAIGVGVIAGVSALIYALARKVKAAPLGFTLGIINAPAGAVLWNANFAEKSFEYDPIADSGWLAIDQIWKYPSDPRGTTSLHIWVVDEENNVLLDIYNLGPVDNGEDYVYDCTTGILEARR